MASGASTSTIYEERYGIRRSTKELATEARQGKREAVELFEQSGYYIGKAASHAINLLGLDTVVLGGGMAESFDLLKSGIHDALARYVFKQGNPNVRVIHSPLGQFAALKGCAALVLDKEKENRI